LFKKLGILGTKLPLGEIIKRISTSSLGSWFVKMLQKLMSGVSTITGWITKGINWLATKLGIKGLTKATSNITSKVSSIVDEISAATSKFIKPKVTQLKQVLKPKVTQLKQALKPKVTQLKQGLQTVGSGLKKGLTSKSGQVATAAGLTYGINKGFGGSTDVLGGAFVDKEGQLNDFLVSNNSGWDVNDLP
jgi:phage-related protein